MQDIIRLCNNAVSHFLTEDERRDIAQAADYYWRKSEYNASSNYGRMDFRTRIVAALDALIAAFEGEAQGNAVHESILDRVAYLMTTIDNGGSRVTDTVRTSAVAGVPRDAVAGDDFPF